MNDHLQTSIDQLAMTDSHARSRSRLYNLVESVSEIWPEVRVGLMHW